MKGKLFLIHWDPPSAGALAGSLRSAGWGVEVESEDDRRAYRSIRSEPPDLVVVDLGRRSSHGREIARSLRNTKGLQSLPIVLLDASPREAAKLRAEIGEAVFATPDELLGLLDRLFPGPDEEAAP